MIGVCSLDFSSTHMSLYNFQIGSKNSCEVIKTACAFCNVEGEYEFHFIRNITQVQNSSRRASCFNRSDVRPRYNVLSEPENEEPSKKFPLWRHETKHVVLTDLLYLFVCSPDFSVWVALHKCLHNLYTWVCQDTREMTLTFRIIHSLCKS